MNTIKLFLASSLELSSDRKDFEIFINRKNIELKKDKIFIELMVWDNMIEAMSKTRLQDSYNRAISDSDIFVSLFYTKVGKYTEEEFINAYNFFRENGKPLVYTYFKNSPINTEDINDGILSLINFKKKIRDLGHFYSTYNEINELKYKFGEQIIKILKEWKEQNYFSYTEENKKEETITSENVHINVSGMSNEIWLRKGKKLNYNSIVSGMKGTSNFFIPNYVQVKLTLSGMNNNIYIDNAIKQQIQIKNSGLGNLINNI